METCSAVRPTGTDDDFKASALFLTGIGIIGLSFPVTAARIAFLPELEWLFRWKQVGLVLVGVVLLLWATETAALPEEGVSP